MTRLLLSTTAAIVMLAAPVAASAATTKPMVHRTAAHRTMHHAAKPMGRHMAAAPARARDGGSAAVDALNEQALARARAGQ